jgi:tetratricopeptide (TPR) repeat protein
MLPLCLFSQSYFNGSGEIQTRPGVDPSQFTVEVSVSGGGSMPEQRLSVAPNGRFELRNLPLGAYSIRVLDERGSTVGTSSFHSSAATPIEIRVQAGIAKQSVGPVRAVSVESLRADPEGKAEREFRYALWDANTKDWKNAAKHFEKALRHDARHTGAAANWAAMEFIRGDHAQAETVARRGLQYSPKDGRLLHALGMSLLAQGRSTDEAIEALTNAGREIPKVLLMAAQAEYARGNWRQTRKLADAYLQSGDKEQDAVAARLKALPGISK